AHLRARPHRAVPVWHRLEVRMAEGDPPITAQHRRRVPIHGGRWRTAHLVAGLELGWAGKSHLHAAQSRQASAPQPNHDGPASTNGRDRRLVLVARRVSGWMADFRSLCRAYSRYPAILRLAYTKAELARTGSAMIRRCRPRLLCGVQ